MACTPAGAAHETHRRAPVPPRVHPRHYRRWPVRTGDGAGLVLEVRRVEGGAAMRVQVEQVTVSGTVATCVGIDVDTGRRVAFYAEHRAASAIAEQVAAASDRDGLPVATVEPWQLPGV